MRGVECHPGAGWVLLKQGNRNFCLWDVLKIAPRYNFCWGVSAVALIKGRGETLNWMKMSLLQMVTNPKENSEARIILQNDLEMRYVAWVFLSYPQPSTPTSTSHMIWAVREKEMWLTVRRASLQLGDCWRGTRLRTSAATPGSWRNECFSPERDVKCKLSLTVSLSQP